MKNYFNHQYQRINKDLDIRLKKIFKNFNFILGNEVKELEEKLEKLTKSRFVIGTSSGTDALILALMAIKIKPNDEVITTPFSWISNAEAIKLVGAKPVYVDIDPQTFNIDYDNKKNIKIIEDGAQSFGAKIGKKYSSSYADIFCTSFFPTKPLGCFGDGGACMTNSKSLADQIKLIRNHCQIKKNIHKGVGLNARLDTIQAAVLLSKIKIFEKEIFLRNRVVQSIKKGISIRNSKIQFQKIKKHTTSAHAQLPIIIKNRNKLIKILKKNKINFSIFYPKPIYKQKGYNEKKYFLSNVEDVCKKIVCLQVNPYMTKTEINILIKKIIQY